MAITPPDTPQDILVKTFKELTPRGCPVEFMAYHRFDRFSVELVVRDLGSGVLAAIEIGQDMIHDILSDHTFLNDTHRNLMGELAKQHKARANIAKYIFKISRYETDYGAWFIQVNNMTHGPFDDEDTAFAAYLLLLEK